MIQLLFSISLFLSAFLLFVIQPIIAKLILPAYGGTPAVWTICMLYFQTLLLLAYGYVWLLSRLNSTACWRGVHGVLVLLSFFAFPLSTTPSADIDSPDLAILGYLVTHLGLPVFVIGASASLLQFAYSQTQAKSAHDPYFLYVISNLGSLLALLAYPFVIERYIGLQLQFYYWSLGFALYVIFLFIALFMVSSKQQKYKPREQNQALSWLLPLRWISYSFIPCSLMLGVTFYISTDIAATPLFWIIPLALYLLSFIITFAQKPIIPHEWVKRHILFFIIFPVISFIIGESLLQAWELIFFHLTSFLMLSLLCQGELVRTRPAAHHLASFYFYLALGGALAGLFNGLLAPRFFIGAYEYPLILVCSMLCICLPKFSGIKGMSTSLILLVLLLLNYFLPKQLWLKTHHVLEILGFSILIIWPKNRINLFVGMAILFVFLMSPWFKPMKIVVRQRNFFGVKQVLEVSGARVLISQNTLHGFQFAKYKKDSTSMAYYGPVLTVVNYLQQRHSIINTTVIGLGTGMLACQFRANDQLKIIDIDKQVIDIAFKYFTYLRDCLPKISVKEGDGRIVLAADPQANLDLLVVDAFTSDAIPTHLLTLETFKLYQHKIKQEGVILVNVSNRHLRLLPVILASGRKLGLIVLHHQQGWNYQEGKFAAEWVLLTTNLTLAQELMRLGEWHFVAEPDSNQLWTDDYSNIIPLLK